ncbi:MAG: OmpH family outer membrane protein [Bacteroidota bacterium]|nr:OmpH family outer membrane protein [Bacteroidota bacterium]
MKKGLLVINLILIVLVGYLYYRQFEPAHKWDSSEMVTRQSPASAHGSSLVAYIDLDSLQNNYVYYKKIKAEFEKKQEAANDELTALQKKYQTRAMQLQQKSAGMTQQEQQSAMDEINKMQQDLQQKKQSIDNDLYNYNTKMKEDILSRIQNFLKQYNKDGRYAYIFSYEPGFMFYKDSTLNITSDVISGLNSLYSDGNK